MYSSVLHDGWTTCAVFNGVYKVAHDYDTNPETKARIDAWIDAEEKRGSAPARAAHQADRRAGPASSRSTAPDQKLIGNTLVTVEHEPLSLVRYRQTTTWEGVVNRRYTVERTRHANNWTYDGPDQFGNARAYGRALYVSQHFTGPDVWKIKGREFLLDESLQMAVTWMAYEGSVLTYIMHGLLEWTADA